MCQSGIETMASAAAAITPPSELLRDAYRPHAFVILFYIYRCFFRLPVDDD